MLEGELVPGRDRNGRLERRRTVGTKLTVPAEHDVDSRNRVLVIVRASAIRDLVGDASELWPEIGVVWMRGDQALELPFEVIEGGVEFESCEHEVILA